MNWLCVKAIFDIAPDDWSPTHETFAKHGCAGTVEHDNPPAMSAYIFGDAIAAKTIGALGKELLDSGAHEVDVQVVPEEDWSESWKQFFKPREIGKRFLIKPSWEEIQPTERVVIELDPGQAFGTGEHPTTRLCLSMLEEAVQKGDKVLDIGCGSGVLSVAAYALSKKQVHATEIDGAAGVAANSNFDRNKAMVTLHIGESIPTDWLEFDVIVSNIVSAVLIRLAPAVKAAIADGGTWVISGVIPANWEDVSNAAERNGFAFVTKREEDGWLAAIFRAR